MKTTFRIIAAVLAAAVCFIMAAICCYYYSLPDRFYVDRRSRLELNTRFLITASAEGSAGKVSGPMGSDSAKLRLFGVFPIKSVSEQLVEAPLLSPGGEAFGIKLISDGVMVVDLQKGSCAAEKCGIKQGDVIISIDGEEVGTNREVAQAIRDAGGETVPVVVRRDGEEMTIKLTPELTSGSYRAGMWVRDSSAGIGTLTFFQPETGIFGGLGHPVCDPDTGDAVPIKEGKAAPVTIHGLNKSENGAPGALLGSFAGGPSLGDIYENSGCGVFGVMERPLTDKPLIPLGFRQDVRCGEAYIYASLDGSAPKKYSIFIEEVDLNSSDRKDLVIRVTDKQLLKKTGGILQGMSGSPIIQNGRLVGAITHVFVKTADMGYGIFADRMYSEAVNVYSSRQARAVS